MKLLKEAKTDKLHELLYQKNEFLTVTEGLLSKFTKKLSEFSLIKIENKFIRECTRLEAALPIYAKKSEIIEHVVNNQVCVILGETGSGKSTQLVQYLYEAYIENKQKGQIVCTQPRKVAAISLARRVSHELNSDILVGHHVGSNFKEHIKTAIKYVTDRVLLNEYMKDPLLNKYKCIIVDEAHERSLFTDLLLGLLKKLLPKRPDIRLVITSATIDPRVFCSFFKSNTVIKVSGRLFPIDVIYNQEKSSIDNYIKCCVDKTWKVISSSKHKGDVLVFFTSAADIEMAVKLLMNYPGARDVVHCITLHGSLPSDEQQKVFEIAPSGKRKVVFSTNVAETSVTIPGINCVIDAGLAKEKIYDPKRKIASLQICQISQSSAEQRKGRAGRTQPGVCYRLFTEEQFNAMRPSSQPEIMNANLGLVILLFLEMGIPNPQDFEFIQSPPRELFTTAMNTLNQLGAVYNGRLTNIGVNLIKLDLEPRYGKLLLRGIQENVGFDTLCITALYKNSNNVFYRGKTQNEKEKSDKLKVRFCHDKGDVLTALNVFQEWWQVGNDRKKKKAWCVANSINSKSMDSAFQTVNEISKSLEELNLKFEQNFSDNTIRDVIIPRIILECFSENTARFTGCRKKGYFTTSTDQNLFLHPSSSLSVFGNLPKWVVYEEVLSTSQDFITNVTTVEQQDFYELVKRGIIKCNLESLELKTLHAKTISGLGVRVLQNLIGPKGKSVRDMESNIQQMICSKSGLSLLCSIEITFIEGRFTLYSPLKTQAIAMEMVFEQIKKHRKILSDEVFEKSLVQNSAVKVIYQAGGSVKSMIMPGEFRTLTINSIPESIGEKVLMAKLSRIGKHNVFRYKSGSWGKIIYSNISDAKKAFELCEKLNIPVKPQSTPDQKYEFRINISWLRRPLIGCAYVNFDSYDIKCKFMQANSYEGFIVNGQYLNVSTSKKKLSEIYVKGITSAISSEDIYQVIIKKLPEALGNVSVIIPRKRCSLPSDYLNLFKQQLDYEINGIIKNKSLKCKVTSSNIFKITPETWYGRGFVLCNNTECASVIADALNLVKIENAEIEACLELSSTISVKKKIHEVIEGKIDKFLTKKKENLEMLKMKVIKRCQKSGDFLITIIGGVSRHVALIRKRLTKIISPHIFPVHTIELFQMFENKRSKFITTIMQELNIFVELDYRLLTLNIYGRSINCKAALKKIELFKESTGQINKEINLRGNNKPRGLLKDLLVEFGSNLEYLKSKTQALTCDINFRDHSLTFSGSGKSFARLLEILKMREHILLKQSVNESSRVEEGAECPVCLTMVNLDSCLNLELCGHSYCIECIRNVLDNAIKSKLFPIACCKTGCSIPIAIADLKQLLKYDSLYWDQISHASLSSFVNKSGGQYRHCITANCPMVYKVTMATDIPASFKCPICRILICTRCKDVYHESLTCDIYQNNKDIEPWMNENRVLRGFCPRCHVPIEKNEGCFHMTCVCCETHICWLCRKTFPSSDDVYNHQRKCQRTYSNLY